MSFYESVWKQSFEVTQKDPTEVKIRISDDYSCPILDADKLGHILYFPRPKPLKNGLVRYSSIILDTSREWNKSALSSLFSASVTHLSAHAVASDFRLYRQWAKEKSRRLAIFVTSIVEDAVVRGFLRARWPVRLHDIAAADATCYLLLKPAHVFRRTASKAMAGLFSLLLVGNIKGSLPEKMQQDLTDANHHLCTLEEDCEKTYAHAYKSDQNKPLLERLPLAEHRLKTASEVYRLLHKFGPFLDIPSIPYSEHHDRGGLLFFNTMDISEAEIKEAVIHAYQRSSNSATILDTSGKPITDIQEAEKRLNALRREAQQKAKAIKRLESIDVKTHFQGIFFPDEDICEYWRAKVRITTTIRKLINALRAAKNAPDEDWGKESGILDLPMAIQSIASNTPKTDVWIDNEPLFLSESWAMLMDASTSVQVAEDDARTFGVCIAEAAKGLIKEQGSFGLFAFNDNFFIVKDFDENFSQKTMARMGGLRYGGRGFLPDAIRIAMEMLRRRMEERKILLVLSDGITQGYHGIVEETREALADVESNEITPIGISVNSLSMKTLFRRFILARTPKQFSDQFVKIYYSLE